MTPDSTRRVIHDQIHRRHMDCYVDQISPSTAMKRFLIGIFVLYITFVIAVIFGMGNHGQ